MNPLPTKPTRLLLAPSEVTMRLVLSLVAAACANLIGSLTDTPPTGWQWIKIALSTASVVAVNWRAFITNPQQTTSDPVPAQTPETPPEAPTPPYTAVVPFAPPMTPPPGGSPQ